MDHDEYEHKRKMNETRSVSDDDGSLESARKTNDAVHNVVGQETARKMNKIMSDVSNDKKDYWGNRVRQDREDYGEKMRLYGRNRKK